MSPGANVAEAFHQRGVFLGAARLLGKLEEPLAERCIQGSLLGSCDLAGLLNEFVVGAQSDIFHTKTVYTIPV